MPLPPASRTGVICFADDDMRRGYQTGSGLSIHLDCAPHDVVYKYLHDTSLRAVLSWSWGSRVPGGICFFSFKLGCLAPSSVFDVVRDCGAHSPCVVRFIALGARVAWRIVVIFFGQRIPHLVSWRRSKIRRDCREGVIGPVVIVATVDMEDFLQSRSMGRGAGAHGFGVSVVAAF